MVKPHVSLITDVHSKLFNENVSYSGTEMIYVKGLKGITGTTCESVQVTLSGRKLLGIETDCNRRCQGTLAR